MHDRGISGKADALDIVRTDRLIREIADRPGLCHCSSVEALPNGDLLAVWYEGAYETAPGTAIRSSRLPAGSAEWENARDLLRYDGVPLGNPVLCRLPVGNADVRDAGLKSTESLSLIFSLLLGESWTESLLFLVRSDDGGQNWTNPELFSPRKGLMAKTKPIRLPGGRVVVPLYDEAGYFPVVMVVDEPGDWARGQITAETMSRNIAIQPAIVRRPDGSLLMYCRSRRGVIWRSISRNDGLSWSIGEATKIPNPDAAVDLLDVGGGNLVLAYNPSANDRHRLDIVVSPDAGTTWTSGVSVVSGDGEYSYPCLTLSNDGAVHLVYTEDRYRVQHVEIELDALVSARLETPVHSG